MAVEAVVSVVLQKLADILKEESLTQNKVIVYEMDEIIKSLKKMRNLVIAGQVDDRLKPAAKPRPAEDNLVILYDVEDEIEKFTLAIAHQRKAFGFLANYTFFFNNFNSCRNLRSKLQKITTQLKKKLISSPTTTLSRQCNHLSICDALSDADPIEDEENEEKEAGDHKTVTSAMLKTSSSTFTSKTYTASPKNDCGKTLTFSYSNNHEELQIVGIKEERLQHPKHMSSFSYREEELGIFGFKDDVKTLVEQLIENSQHVVSIIGEVGTGKTTLARAIYRNRGIKHHFELRAWFSVLKEHTVQDILLTLLKGLDNLKEKTYSILDEKSIKFKVSEFLKDKRYLIVLDGISTCDIWEDMKGIFLDVKNGSKLILTSSETKATTKMSVVTHYLKPLSEEDSWNMFLKKAGKEETKSLIPEELKQKILEICKGLPLNFVLLAGLLSTKDLSSWSNVLSLGQDSVNVLSLCYNDLTVHLKVCLLYLVLFPKEFDIPVRRLLRLWLAEGFVKLKSAKLFPEDVLQKYFEDLVNRNMIQVSKLRSDNSPRRCRVLGVVYDYLLPKAQEISLFNINPDLVSREDGGGPLGVRRMVEYVDTKGVSLKRGRGNDRKELGETVYPSFLSLFSSFFTGGNQTNNERDIEKCTMPSPQKTQSKTFNPSLLQSYLSFNVQKKDMPAKEVGSLLGSIINNGFGLLRVLDLEGVYKPSLPEKLGNLHHLRYLGLRWTFLDSLPQSVGDLPYLQTLDVKHTFIDELPDSIWRLKHLRHINLNEIRLDMQPRSSLTLLTLWGLFLDEKIAVKNGLDKLLYLRELGITFYLSSSQDDLMDWIVNLRALQSLRLRSIDETGRPSKLILKPMSKLGQLSHLNLLGNLEKLPEVNEFPPTLKVLTLSISLLKKDPMQTLGLLPCLTVLRLLGQSYIGKEMVIQSGGFSKLRVLKLWMLKELESWEVEEGAMQILKHLNIRSCHKLKNIPTSLLQKRSLEELVLTDMPDKFTTEVERIKSIDTSVVVNQWKFPPLPWGEDHYTILQQN